MDNNVTVNNDVMSSNGKDEKKQELNIVSPHFSSEKNETECGSPKGCLRKPN